MALPPRPGLYVHVPFCVHRCGYCDFVTWAGREHQIDAYLDALGLEVQRRASTLTGPVETTFLGGGTPSVLGPVRLRRLLEEVLAPLGALDADEVSVECNPESVTPELAATLSDLGVHRVSLGVQSFDDRELAALERAHDKAGALQAVETLRAAGLNRLSLDLIYGLPNQTLEGFLANLDQALELDPGHLSLYGLKIEPGSPWGQRGIPAGMSLPDGDLQADMYEGALERLRGAGYVGYEISNFAKPGLESRHNLKYWRGEPVLGLGVGAWGASSGVRDRNSSSFETYLKDQETGRGPFAIENLSPAERSREQLVMSLRLREGIDPRQLQAQEEAGRSLAVLERYRGFGLVEEADSLWRLTDRGRMLANEVMAELL